MIDPYTAFEERTQDIKGTSNNKWCWIKEDLGAWDGPIKDWNEHHFDKFVMPIERKHTVVTAGGNMGLYTRAYSELFERVYVFEPDHENFHALVRNNLAENVFFFRAALGSKQGWCHINKSCDMGNRGMHTVEKNITGSVPVMTIDSLQLEQCDLIQLDIEGYERYAIPGAVETIKRHAPVVVTEGNHATVRKTLAEMGYESTETSKADFIFRRK